MHCDVLCVCMCMLCIYLSHYVYKCVLYVSLSWCIVMCYVYVCVRPKPRSKTFWNGVLAATWLFQSDDFPIQKFEKARGQGTSAFLQHKLSGNGKRLFVKRSRLRLVAGGEELKLKARSYTYIYTCMPLTYVYCMCGHQHTTWCSYVHYRYNVVMYVYVYVWPCMCKIIYVTVYV